jgi:carbohydrate kinase (thermoresistant glucokinase family)
MIVLVMGVAGCGKSTIGSLLAARLGVAFAEGDGFHPAANVAKMSRGEPLTDADRQPWLAAIAGEIARRAERGESLVVGCSALRRSYRQTLIGNRRDARLIYLKGSPNLIAARMASRRDHFMPPSLLASQFAALEEPGADERPIAADIDAAPDEIVAFVLSALR